MMLYYICKNLVCGLHALSCLKIKPLPFRDGIKTRPQDKNKVTHLGLIGKAIFNLWAFLLCLYVKFCVYCCVLWLFTLKHHLC
jgi:hypothetical protein